MVVKSSLGRLGMSPKAGSSKKAKKLQPELAPSTILLIMPRWILGSSLAATLKAELLATMRQVHSLVGSINDDWLLFESISLTQSLGEVRQPVIVD